MLVKFEPERVQIYHNYAKKSASQIRKEIGCDYVFNASLFNMSSRAIYCPTKINGAWYGLDGYCYMGYGWKAGELPRMMTSKDAEAAEITNFVSCIWAITDGKAEQLHYNSDVAGKRGRTAFGMTADGQMVILCTCDVSDPMTPEQARDRLMAQGCISGIVLDGGGSSQISSEKNSIVSARNVPVLICVWEKNTKRDDTKKFKVALDPGHGLKEPNQSPDGKYLEYKMAWALAHKTKELLESTERFEVLITKNSESETSTLSERAAKANEWGADIFISIHSNAVGTGAWTDGTHGLTAWIYALGGNRQELAQRFIEQCEELGIELFGQQLYTAKFAVLARTTMPAMLTENYFHTCRTDVAKLQSDKELETLAYAHARGICEYFNLGCDLLVPEAEEQKVLKDIIWRVQVGAFDSEESAENMAALLEKQGYATMVTQEEKKK